MTNCIFCLTIKSNVNTFSISIFTIKRSCCSYYQFGLAQSLYEDDDDDYMGIKHTHKVKSELDALTDDKYNKSSSIKKEEKQSERKSRKDRTT